MFRNFGRKNMEKYTLFNLISSRNYAYGKKCINTLKALRF